MMEVRSREEMNMDDHYEVSPLTPATSQPNFVTTETNYNVSSDSFNEGSYRNEGGLEASDQSTSSSPEIIPRYNERDSIAEDSTQENHRSHFEQTSSEYKSSNSDDRTAERNTTESEAHVSTQPSADAKARWAMLASLAGVSHKDKPSDRNDPPASAVERHEIIKQVFSDRRDSDLVEAKDEHLMPAAEDFLALEQKHHALGRADSKSLPAFRTLEHHANRTGNSRADDELFFHRSPSGPSSDPFLSNLLRTKDDIASLQKPGGRDGHFRSKSSMGINEEVKSMSNSMMDFAKFENSRLESLEKKTEGAWWKAEGATGEEAHRMMQDVEHEGSKLHHEADEALHGVENLEGKASDELLHAEESIAADVYSGKITFQEGLQAAVKAKMGTSFMHDMKNGEGKLDHLAHKDAAEISKELQKGEHASAAELHHLEEKAHNSIEESKSELHHLEGEAHAGVEKTESVLADMFNGKMTFGEGLRAGISNKLSNAGKEAKTDLSRMENTAEHDKNALEHGASGIMGSIARASESAKDGLKRTLDSNHLPIERAKIEHALGEGKQLIRKGSHELEQTRLGSKLSQEAMKLGEKAREIKGEVRKDSLRHEDLGAGMQSARDWLKKPGSMPTADHRSDVRPTHERPSSQQGDRPHPPQASGHQGGSQGRPPAGNQHAPSNVNPIHQGAMGQPHQNQQPHQSQQPMRNPPVNPHQPNPNMPHPPPGMQQHQPPPPPRAPAPHPNQQAQRPMPPRPDQRPPQANPGQRPPPPRPNQQPPIPHPQASHPQAPHPQAPHPQAQAPHPQAPHPQAPHPQAPHPQGSHPQGQVPHPQAPHPQAQAPRAQVPHPQAPHPQAPHPQALHPQAQAPHPQAPHPPPGAQSHPLPPNQSMRNAPHPPPQHMPPSNQSHPPQPPIVHQPQRPQEHQQPQRPAQPPTSMRNEPHQRNGPVPKSQMKPYMPSQAHGNAPSRPPIVHQAPPGPHQNQNHASLPNKQPMRPPQSVQNQNHQPNTRDGPRPPPASGSHPQMPSHPGAMKPSPANQNHANPQAMPQRPQSSSTGNLNGQHGQQNHQPMGRMPQTPGHLSNERQPQRGQKAGVPHTGLRQQEPPHSQGMNQIRPGNNSTGPNQPQQQPMSGATRSPANPSTGMLPRGNEAQLPQRQQHPSQHNEDYMSNLAQKWKGNESQNTKTHEFSTFDSSRDEVNATATERLEEHASSSHFDTAGIEITSHNGQSDEIDTEEHEQEHEEAETGDDPGPAAHMIHYINMMRQHSNQYFGQDGEEVSPGFMEQMIELLLKIAEDAVPEIERRLVQNGHQGEQQGGEACE